jgi:putative SOS response-associated peptidase YedK
MCGRFTQLKSWTELVRLYRLADDAVPLNLGPRYNIAPTENAPIVRLRRDGSGRELVMARWGLVPPWSKDVSGARAINARAETVHHLPTFRGAFAKRRCLVAADGFFEWRKLPGGGKQPYFLTLPDERPFAFAGLWEIWRSPSGERVDSFTIVVTAANDLLRPVHDRMPVILETDRFDAWLDVGRSAAEARRLLVPYEGPMVAFPVSRRVNKAGDDDPVCIAPVGPSVTGSGPVPLPEPHLS